MLTGKAPKSSLFYFLPWWQSHTDCLKRHKSSTSPTPPPPHLSWKIACRHFICQSSSWVGVGVSVNESVQDSLFSDLILEILLVSRKGKQSPWELLGRGNRNGIRNDGREPICGSVGRHGWGPRLGSFSVCDLGRRPWKLSSLFYLFVEMGLTSA